ncbi:MAG: 3-oxoacyl-[acyl-carrier-protein] reductase [Nitrospinota bacterium]|jgi:3-oxoacyl-[acyl-carrier protein] reductase|nr:3-oxoacyl-[acyl-carrier-protein] reductase [Nitrospinota bacterium]MDP7581483.1 3-oxoacyl-[acyl-carrier-protein] reductase [Nitrospinota bacterium]HJN01967.1 3-oxoacyl-[acyl-carrier-protein] reductase [Nitrospinota bacterium]|tara:strand:+ start:325 stop:1065 length:741 start_codon:yes stop_codon:yes gene_type:complete
MPLKGQTAVVTGGARGIGKEISLALARDGANIVIADLIAEQSEETAEEIKKLNCKALIQKVDISKTADVENMVQNTINEFKTLDILINNAGVTRDTLMVRMKEEDWDFVLKVNLTGTFNCSKAAAKYMMKQKKGRIVNIASIVGVMGNAGQANYSASKAGIIGLTKTSARELASRNITVNAVAPGFIDTEMTRSLNENIKQQLKEQIPVGKLGRPEDIANCIKFLVSDDASYITGQVIHVNGGMLM